MFIGIIAALLSAASWAVGTILFDKIGKCIPAAGMTFLKGLSSILFMSLLLCIYGLQHLSAEELLLLAASGLIGIAIGDTFFFKSLQYLGAKMQVIYFMLGQVLTAFLSYLFLGEILSAKTYVGGLLVLGGVIMVIAGKQEGHPNKIRGIVGGILAMLCYSISPIILKGIISDISAVTATFYRMLFGTIFVLFGGAFSTNVKNWFVPLKNIKVLRLFLFNVAIVTYGGFLLSIVAIKYIDVTIASVLATTEPIFVLLLSYILYHEKAAWREILGTIITLSGIFIIMLNG